MVGAAALLAVCGPGTVLCGRYRLGSRVGVGGSAEVFRAFDLLLRRIVAIKVLVDSDEDDGRASRFDEEARLTASLDHPHLIPQYAAGTDGAHRFHVMALIDGPTLADKVRLGSVSRAEVCRMALALAETLAHIHARGIVHRDVKPSNILLDADGKVFLADFGIAQAPDTPRLSETDLILGSPGYLAPEQLQGRDACPATDVHALGLVLLEALTGQREYDGTALERAAGRLIRPPRIPSGLGLRWCATLTAMTSAEVAERPTAARAGEMLAECPWQEHSPHRVLRSPEADVAHVLTRTGLQVGRRWWRPCGRPSELV
jgi:serine/threonine protein kinase